jgi:hypothetical protein
MSYHELFDCQFGIIMIAVERALMMKKFQFSMMGRHERIFLPSTSHEHRIFFFMMQNERKIPSKTSHLARLKKEKSH